MLKAELFSEIKREKIGFALRKIKGRKVGEHTKMEEERGRNRDKC